MSKKVKKGGKLFYIFNNPNVLSLIPEIHRTQDQIPQGSYFFFFLSFMHALFTRASIELVSFTRFTHVLFREN